VKIVLATNNQHKVDEIKSVIKHIDLVTLQDIGCHEELPETTDTLEGNALQKARFVFDRYQLPCVADDSGLETEALHGAPGVHSAYFAGPQRSSEDNIGLLLQKLAGHSNRRAQFRTVIALATATGTQLFEGTVKGIIINERRGTNGFGYDSVFMPENTDKTFAQMSLKEKNTLSHRAQALAKLTAYLSVNPV
jgi:XTP/dITP diphosphohydrolase